MNLTEARPDAVWYVAANMRAIDRDEIYGLRFHDDPFKITQEVMARPEFTWVAWWEDKPAVVIGGTEVTPKVWSMHCFATDKFPRLALPLTRFTKTKILPIIFDEFGAHRMFADSIETHTEAHRWLELFGARKEGVQRARGRNGEDYFTFAIVKPVDSAKAQV